jgi:predicted nucleic-acid-binding protein
MKIVFYLEGLLLLKCDRCNKDIDILDEGNIIQNESICKTCALELKDLTDMAIKHYESELEKSEDFLRSSKNNLKQYKDFVRSGEEFVKRDKKLVEHYKNRLKMINSFGG